MYSLRCATKEDRIAARAYRVSKDKRLVLDHDSGTQVYAGVNSKGKPVAMGFRGTSSKPAFNYQFRSQEEMERHIAKWIADIMAREKAKQERDKERKHNVAVGDVLYTSWGYDQTNVDFYQVTRIVGKATFEVRELATMSTETHFMSGYIVPVPNEFCSDKIIRVRVGSSGHGKIDGQYAWPLSYTETAAGRVYKGKYHSWYA